MHYKNYLSYKTYCSFVLIRQLNTPRFIIFICIDEIPSVHQRQQKIQRKEVKFINELQICKWIFGSILYIFGATAVNVPIAAFLIYYKTQTTTDKHTIQTFKCDCSFIKILVFYLERQKRTLIGFHSICLCPFRPQATINNSKNEITKNAMALLTQRHLIRVFVCGQKWRTKNWWQKWTVKLHIKNAKFKPKNSMDNF